MCFFVGLFFFLLLFLSSIDKLEANVDGGILKEIDGWVGVESKREKEAYNLCSGNLKWFTKLRRFQNQSEA